MTSFPIMWFALYDLEYLKRDFMTKPLLYKIGMNNECFSIPIYVYWTLYALLHGALIFIFCVLAVDGVTQSRGSDGKAVSFWVSGHLVYGVCCFVANALILTRTNNFTGYGEGLNGLMNFAYFFFMLVLSALGSTSFSALNHIFENMFAMGIVWLSILLTVGSVVAMELGFRNWFKLILNTNEKRADNYHALDDS